MKLHKYDNIQEELERIKKIIKRASDKAAGTLDIDSLLTEDNPDGCKLSILFWDRLPFYGILSGCATKFSG